MLWLKPHMNPLFKHPTAWIPPVMSLAALTIVLTHIAIYGITREADEGAAAHLFQILITAQVPLIAVFAIKWLRRTPKHGVLSAELRSAGGGYFFEARMRRTDVRPIWRRQGDGGFADSVAEELVDLFRVQRAVGGRPKRLPFSEA
jgi:hypothetical protein